MVYGFDENKHKVDSFAKNVWYSISPSATSISEDIPVSRIGETSFNNWKVIGARYYGVKTIDGDTVRLNKEFNPIWYMSEDKTTLHIEYGTLDTSQIEVLIGFEIDLIKAQDV